jgi:glycosyltransferase involved in cell wall biosynthesis
LQLLAIAGGLDRSRWRPVCVLPERGELASLLEVVGAEVIVHPLAVLRRELLRPGGLLELRRRLREDWRVLGRVARERSVALVHSNTSVVLAGSSLGAPHLQHVREIYAGAGPAVLWPLWCRRLLRADALACVSAAVAQQFKDRPKVFVLHDGLPRTPAPVPREEAREKLGLPLDRFVVALLGRVSDWKGQDVLAEALLELDDIGAIGLIAGDAWPGQERIERELAARADGLGDRLRLLGFRDDVDTVLGAADAVAVPSKRPDPLPNSALEAAAAGLPLVAAAHGGLVEIVRDGETGLLVPPGNASALAGALRRLAGDRDLRTRLGEAAARDANERFGRERMLAELEAVYARLSR